MREVREKSPSVLEGRRGRPRSLRIRGQVIKPYKGKDDLPEEKIDSKGNLIASGEPRHFVARSGNNYKVISI